MLLILIGFFQVKSIFEYLPGGGVDHYGVM